MTRRYALGLMGSAPLLCGQMASRGIKPSPRNKRSGLPYARLTNVAAAAGLLKPTVYGTPAHMSYIIESIGCGAAFFDFDHDGWLDIFLLSGSRLESKPTVASNRLYRNNRDGTFSDVTQKAGLDRADWAYGVTVADYNNDGFEDIFITCWGQNILYRNNGDGTFTDVTKEAGLWHEKPRFSTGCTFLDYNRSGNLDLFVAHYVGFDMRAVPMAGKDPGCNYKGVPVYCGPRGLPAERCSLYRNNGDGTFTDVSKISGIDGPSDSYGLTAVAADFDDDGWPDIYVACDSTASLLFRNNHDGTFTEAGLEHGVALNDTGQEQAGMGVGVGDFNLDGRLDLLKTNFSEDTVTLYENAGAIGFRDVTLRARLGVETEYVCWGAGIADLDNNGLADLFWVTGNAYPEPEEKLPNSPFRTPPVLFRNLGSGRFEQLFQEAGPALAEIHCSRGCAFGDFDNDGDLDVLILNLNEPPSLLRNDTLPENRWLKVRLVTGKCNRDAVGARVIACYGDRIQTQEVLAQSSYLSVNDKRLHFGLGPIRTASLDIRWPSGHSEKILNVSSNCLVTVKEGAGIIKTQIF